MLSSHGQFLSFFCCPVSKRALGHKELGGDRTRTADQKWPKGYSIPCETNLKNSGELIKRADLTLGLAGHRLVGGE